MQEIFLKQRSNKAVIEGEEKGTIVPDISFVPYVAYKYHKNIFCKNTDTKLSFWIETYKI